MAALRDTSNCGMKELHGLNVPTPELLRTALRATAGIIVFSDAVHCGNGARLFREIDDFGLGACVQCDPVRNPHSGNSIQGYVWNPNQAAIRARLTPKARRKVAGKTRKARRR